MTKLGGRKRRSRGSPACHGLAAIAVGALALAAAAPAGAETSSWVQRADPPPAAEGARRTGRTTTETVGAAADMPNSSTFAKPPARGVPKGTPEFPAPPSAKDKLRPSLDAAQVPPTGPDAAYIAFDQGQYLTALKLAEAAAAEGQPAAHTLIARIYEEGHGVPPDLKVAAQWYTRAAELGDVNAMFALGVMAAEGRGVVKDRTAAAQMFENAARSGHPEANYNLGLLFLSGDGKPENPIRGAQHIRYAAEQGLAAAQYDLSALYQSGRGVDADAYEAAHWLARAADQGMAAAEYDYAVMLLRGFGLKKDEYRAVSLMQAAAEKGVAGAQNRLAHLFAEGLGVGKSPAEMAKWRFIAKDNGVEDAALDEAVARLDAKTRDAARKAATQWRERSMIEPLRP